MTREEAKKVFEYLEKKANTQEPCRVKNELNVELNELEPCTDTVSIRKDALKTRVGNIVAYNVEWLKDHWQMEMDIVCGVKPCDDAISREYLKKIAQSEGAYGYVSAYDIATAPSVTPKPTECDDAISREELLKAIDTWDKFGVDDTNSLFRLDNLSLPHYIPYIHYDDVIKCIKGMPSVTQKSGKWIDKDVRKEEYVLTGKCSVCGQVRVRDKFCSYCGARMESGDKE